MGKRDRRAEAEGGGEAVADHAVFATVLEPVGAGCVIHKAAPVDGCRYCHAGGQ